MNDRLKKILRLVLSAALAVVLLYFCFRGVSWSEFLNVLGQCRWSLVLGAMLCGVFAYMLRSLRWKLMLDPFDRSIPLLSCYDGFTIGKVADYAVPHVGEFVRCMYVVTPKATYDKVLGTVVLDRVWDVFMLGILLLVTLFFKWEDFGAFFMERIVSPASSRLDMSLWWVLAVVMVLAASAAWMLFAFRTRNKFCSKVYDGMKGIFQGVAGIVRMDGKLLFILYTAGLWFMFLLMSWFTIRALPADYGLNLMDAMFIMLLGSIAGIVPVPGGFGAFHYLIAIALQTLYGIPFGMGLIFATLSHESQAVTTFIVGAVSYARQAFFKKKVTNK